MPVLIQQLALLQYHNRCWFDTFTNLFNSTAPDKGLSHQNIQILLATVRPGTQIQVADWNPAMSQLTQAGGEPDCINVRQ